MNKDDIKWEWRKVLGKFRKQWGRITGDETMKIEGRLSVLAQKIQSHYGKTKKETVEMINNFFKK